MTKISELPVQTILAAEDVFPVVDVSEGTTKKVTVSKALPFVPFMPTGDTSGAADLANFNTAKASLTPGGGLIFAGPGIFYGNFTLPAQTASGTDQGGPINLQGCRGATIFRPVGSGVTGLSCHRTDGYSGQFGLAAQKVVNRIKDITIDGTNATGASVGLDFGDGWGFDIDVDVCNFTGTGAIGINNMNRVFWTEKLRLTADVRNCTNSFVKDTTWVSGSGAPYRSHEYAEVRLWNFSNLTTPQQKIFTIKNASYWSGGFLQIQGNMGSTNNALESPPPAVITVGGGTSDGVEGNWSKLQRMILNVNVESNQNLTNGPRTIHYVNASNAIEACTGCLVFQFSPWTLSNISAGSQLSFGGVIYGDSGLISTRTAPSGWV